MNTTTTNLLLNSYNVTTNENPTIKSYAIVGEYIITGKRGATYKTYRSPNGRSVQFIAESGKFAALYGNHSLPVEMVAKCAVTFTDADRI